MSVAAECALVEEAIQRARSLVVPCSPPSRNLAFGDIGGAAESTEAAMRMTDDSAGAFVTAYRGFATRNAISLESAERTDGDLQTQMATAAALTRDSARRMDTIVEYSHAALQAAARATSPTAQRALLSAMRTQLFHASEVVDAISRHGAELAGRIEALDYGFATAPRPLDRPLPQGPIVWCLRPNGTFGMYRCSILYPNLRVSSYWSLTDDTNGQL